MIWNQLSFAASELSSNAATGQWTMLGQGLWF